MLKQQTTVQFAADGLKKLLAGASRRSAEDKGAYRRATALLIQFERCDWQPRAFQAALDQAAPRKFSEQAGVFVYAGEHLAQDLAQVLETYIGMLAPCGEQMPER